MPSILRIVLVPLLLLPTARATADEARDIVAKAIQSHGGAERLARTATGRIKASVDGTIGPVGPIKVTWEEVFDLPGRYRRKVDGTGAGMEFHMEYGVNGKQGWLRQGQGPPRDFPVTEPVPLGSHWHAVLAQLLRLQDKEAQLTYLGEEQLGGRTLRGVRVVSSDSQANVYFDKATNLLARSRRPLPNLGVGRETIGETTYEDYRDVAGVKYPMHMKASNGDTYSLNIVVSSIELLDKIDASAFAKPEVPPGGGERDKFLDDIPEPREQPVQPGASVTPVNWDAWLIAATLGVGGIVGAVWLIVRLSAKRQRPTPPQ